MIPKLQLLLALVLALTRDVTQHDVDKRQIRFDDFSNRRPPTRQSSQLIQQRPGNDGINFQGSFQSGGSSGSCRTSTGKQGRCHLPVQCAVHIEDKNDLISSSCNLPSGGRGICCEDVLTNNARVQPIVHPTKDIAIRTFSSNDLQSATSQGVQRLNSMIRFEEELERKNVVVRPGTPAFNHQLFFQSSAEVQNIGREGLKATEATLELKRRFNLTPDQAGFGLEKVSLRNTQVRCPVAPRCDTGSKYRTIDGSCNNIRNPNWGRANTALERIVLPQYADGVHLPRGSALGGELPNVRLISANVATDSNSPNRDFTLMVMQWGQFLDHDITHVPIAKLKNDEGISCCLDGRVRTNLHPQCFHIKIPPNDAFFRRHDQQCMDFVRSVTGVREQCNFGYSEQINQITHFLDSSNVYGSNDEEARRLRAFRGGLLKTNGINMLPDDLEDEQQCSSFTRGRATCFLAGDSRVNELPNLAVMHTIWMREHNRIANQLSQLHRDWNDGTIFNESRRILNAEWQHITYNEWLPIILGARYMRNFGIRPIQFGHSNTYNANINPSITNEFATAGFRFGHSLVQGIIRLFGQTFRTFSLRNNFNNPNTVRLFFEDLAQGLVSDSIQSFDNHVTDELTNHLFENSNNSATQRRLFGLDLVSLNLQRGRDHGIPGYNVLRETCGLGRARSFGELRREIPQDVVRKFEELYQHVDDIDLFIGGISERPVPGALLGPTFLCIVGDQFLRLKFGDRFFYDLGGQRHSFTEAQLDEIRKSSLARLMCDNTNVQQMQALGFRTADRGSNIQLSCNSNLIPRMDLSQF